MPATMPSARRIGAACQATSRSPRVRLTTGLSKWPTSSSPAMVRVNSVRMGLPTEAGTNVSNQFVPRMSASSRPSSSQPARLMCDTRPRLLRVSSIVCDTSR